MGDFYMIDQVTERVELYKAKIYMRVGEVSRDILLTQQKLSELNKELDGLKGMLQAVAEVKKYITEVKTQFE